jgi:tape measure domain-containing protein
MAVSENAINTEIGVGINLDTLRTVKELSRDIRQLGRETKVSESYFQAQGDTLNASRVKYEGLTKQVTDQTTKVEELKKEQAALTGTTEEEAKKREKLGREISKAELELNKYVIQQDKAKKAYDYEATGLSKLQQERSLNERAIKAEVSALEAEGKTQEATTAKREGAKLSIKSLNSELELQVKELDKLKNNDASEKQIKQQEIYVNNTRKNLGEARQELDKLDGKSKEAFDAVTDNAKKADLSLKDIVKGSALGGLVVSGVNRTISTVSGAVGDAIKRVDTLANSQRTFENLNISTKETTKGMEKLNDAIDGLPTALDSAVSGTTMLVSATKDMDKSVDLFKAVNDGVLGFGGNAQNVDSMVTSLSKSLAAGKITGETLASMYDNKLGPVVEEVAKKMGMTQSELTKAASKGEVDINKFQDALIDLDKNGSKSLSSLDQIASESTKGISTSAQNMSSAVTRSVGHVIEGMGPSLIKMFDGAKDGLNNLKPVFVETGKSLGEIIPIVGDLTVGLLEVAKPVTEISLTLGKAVFKTVGGMVEGIGKAFGIMGSNAEDSEKHVNPIADLLQKIADNKPLLEATGKVVTSIFATKKVFEFGSALQALSGKTMDFKRSFSNGSIKGLNDIMAHLKGVQTESAKATAAINNVGSTNPKGVGKTDTPNINTDKAEASVVSNANKAGKKAGTAFVTGLKGTATVGVGAALATLPTLMSNDSNVKKAGSVAGSVIGGGIGAAFGGPMGATIGAQIGNAIGKNIAEPITNKFNEMFPDVAKSMIDTADKELAAGSAKFSDAYEKMEKDFSEFAEKMNGKKVDIDINIDKLAENEAETREQYGKMSKTINDFYDGQIADVKKANAEELKAGKISQKEHDERIKNATENYNKQRKAKQDINNDLLNRDEKYWAEIRALSNGGNQKLLSVEQTYGKNSKQYKDTLNKEKKRIDADYKKSAESTANKLGKALEKKEESTGNALLDIKRDVKNKKKGISLDEFGEVTSLAKKESKKLIDEAEATKKKTVEAAEKKYKGVVAEEKRKRDETGEISEEQYQKNVAKAKKEKDDTTSESEDKYGKIVKTTNKQKDEVITAAKEQQEKAVEAQRKQSADQVKEAYNGFDWMIKGINSFGDRFNTFLGGLFSGDAKKQIDKLPNMPAYATGTKGLATDEIALVGEEGFELAHHPSLGIFPVGLNSPEIRPLMAGTSILPHTESKQFLSMIDQLPAHKDGVTGFISDAFENVTGAIGSIMDFIGEGTNKAMDHLLNATGFKQTMSDAYEGGAYQGMAEAVGDKHNRGVSGLLDDLFAKIDKELSSMMSGSGVLGRDEFTKIANTAAKKSGITLNGGDISYLWRQAMRESNVNPKVVQGDIGDINNKTGDLAKGLFQFTSATFGSYAQPGHGNIFSAFDQFMAVFNNTNWRRDMPSQFANGAWPQGGTGWGPTGTRRFANGGLINRPELVMAGEEFPEMIIPLDSAKKSQTTQLLNRAEQLAGLDSRHEPAISQTDVKQLTDGVSQLVNLMTQALGVDQAQLAALQRNSTQGNQVDVLNAMGIAQDLSDYQRM